MAAPAKIDYERIEPDWRAGIKSTVQLADEYTAATGTSVDRSAIVKHFKKLGVPRDLKAKIQAKAESMVTAAMVTSIVTGKRECDIIGASATILADIQLSHRSDINRLRMLSMSTLDGIKALDDKAIAQKVDGIKKISETLKTLVALEREAYGLKVTEGGTSAPSGLGHFYGGDN